MTDQTKETPMTFAIRNLSVLSYAQGFTLWHYKARGPLQDTSVEGFFDAVADTLPIGDMILISASDGGRVVFVQAIKPHVVVVSLS